MQLLVVEDDQVIADHIVTGLQSRGHEAALARTGSEAIIALDRCKPDAVVLDRLLPDVSGIAVIDYARSRGNRVPVLMLSALGSVRDRIEGLEVGADDYIAKPFDLGELEARLTAIVRRAAPPPEKALLEVGRLRLDPTSHRAVFAGNFAPLNRKQYSLLAYLMQNADQLVTRSMLLEGVWSYAFTPAANIVESNISRLRTALSGIGCDPIETRRGAGYILNSSLCA